MAEKSIFSKFSARLEGFDAEKIRRSLAIYGDPDASLFKSQHLLITVAFFLLRSGCLTLEIFLHSKFGKRYLSVPKAVVGLSLPAFCLYLGMFDFRIDATINPLSPGMVKVLEPNAARLTAALENEVRSIKLMLSDAKEEKMNGLTSELHKLRTSFDQKTEKLKSEIDQVVTEQDRLKLMIDLSQAAMERAAYENAVVSMPLEVKEKLAKIIEEEDAKEKPDADAKKKPDAETNEVSKRDLPTPSIWQRSFDFFRVLISTEETLVNQKSKTVGREELLSGFVTFLAIYGVAFNIRLLQIYSRRVLDGVGAIKESNPNSSGEPLWIWNPFYLLARFCNAKTDVVKQFVEPFFCYTMGIKLQGILPPHWKFLSAWLIVGSILLFIRTYIENRTREKLHLDRLANEMNAQAYNIQVQAPESSSQVAKAEGL